MRMKFLLFLQKAVKVLETALKLVIRAVADCILST